MSNIQYGLISRVDSDTIEKTIDLICEQFPDDIFCYCEVGLYNGRTTSGVKEYLQHKMMPYYLTGVDNFKDKEVLVYYPGDANLIMGSSIEVYNQIEDGSQHFILIDGNHSLPYVIADFYCYMIKLKVGGYICFHDASPQTQGKSYQRMGGDKDEDMYISVVKALKRIGLIGSKSVCDYLGFKLAFHEWAPPEVDEGGGVIIFKKIK